MKLVEALKRLKPGIKIRPETWARSGFLTISADNPDQIVDESGKEQNMSEIIAFFGEEDWEVIEHD